MRNVSEKVAMLKDLVNVDDVLLLLLLFFLDCFFRFSFWETETFPLLSQLRLYVWLHANHVFRFMSGIFPAK